MQSRNPRSTRNLVVENGIREMVVESNSPESAQKLLMETRDFMRASRIHSVSQATTHYEDDQDIWIGEGRELMGRNY